MTPKAPGILVIGATGLVGRELVGMLHDRGFPCRSLVLAASERSGGTRIEVGGAPRPVRPLAPDLLDDADLVFLCAGSAVSRQWAPEALRRGATVIDNASCFRLDDEVPLVVPEVNGDELEALADGPTLIANPNCSTIIALMAVTPLHRAARVRRMVISTYQAVSGGGSAALAALETQTDEWRRGGSVASGDERAMLFNVFSHESPVGPDGYNEEERKIALESRKIWNDDTVAITATCIRVPVLRAHCESINLTLDRHLDTADAKRLLERAPGVRVVDDRSSGLFPEPRLATGQDDVLVGRIREDGSQPAGHGLELFVAGDQLRKGAALNAVQIAERLYGVVPSKGPTGASAPAIRGRSAARTST